MPGCIIVIIISCNSSRMNDSHLDTCQMAVNDSELSRNPSLLTLTYPAPPPPLPTRWQASVPHE